MSESERIEKLKMNLIDKTESMEYSDILELLSLDLDSIIAEKIESLDVDDLINLI